MRVSGQLLRPGYPLSKSEWGPQAVWTLWRRERSLHLPVTEPRFLGCPASSQVTILTELPRLGCKGTITPNPTSGYRTTPYLHAAAKSQDAAIASSEPKDYRTVTAVFTCQRTHITSLTGTRVP